MGAARGKALQTDTNRTEKFQTSGAGGDGRGEWAMMEQTQISRASEEVRRGMEREDWDKTGEGSREGQSGEKWRELISIDHHRQLHYQHLLDTRWIHNHFLLRMGGCVYVYLSVCVYAVLSAIISKCSLEEILKLTVSVQLFGVCFPPKSSKSIR